MSIACLTSIVWYTNRQSNKWWKISSHISKVGKVTSMWGNELKFPGILYIWLKVNACSNLKTKRSSLSLHATLSFFFNNRIHIVLVQREWRKAKSVFVVLESSSQLWAIIKIIPSPTNIAPSIPKTIKYFYCPPCFQWQSRILSAVSCEITSAFTSSAISFIMFIVFF